MAKSLHNRQQFLSWIFPLTLLFSLIFLHANSIFSQEDDEVEFKQGEQTSQTVENQNDPIKLFNDAQDAHANNDFEKALKLYEEALKANPEFPEAEFQRGSIFQHLGKLLEAEKSFRRAIDLRRDWTLPISELGALLIQKGEFIEAEALLNQAIRVNDMTFPAYVALTELKIKTNASADDLKTLLNKLQFLTTKSKIPASIWASRSAVERKLGDIQSAKTSIKRALSIDEKNSFALEESIEISLLEGDNKGAIAVAKTILQRYPNSINAKILLARSLNADGNSKEAFNILNTIDNPTEEIKKLKTALALIGNDNIETLEKMLETEASNVSILGRLCILSRTVQAQKALVYCQRASQLEPNEINHAIGFGAALVILQRYVEATNLFRKLLEISPENYTIKANLATALFQLNRYEEAILEYQWITQKQPNLAIAYYFLAISHDKSMEYLDAMANYQQFLRLADDSQKLEVEKVNLRLPILQKQIKDGKGKIRR